MFMNTFFQNHSYIKGSIAHSAVWKIWSWLGQEDDYHGWCTGSHGGENTSWECWNIIQWEKKSRDSPDIAATMRSPRVELQSWREDNQRMIKAQEEQNQLNASTLQNLIDIQRKINSRDQTTNPEGSGNSLRRNPHKRSNISRKRSSSGSFDSEESIGGSSSSSHRNKRKRRY